MCPFNVSRIDCSSSNTTRTVQIGPSNFLSAFTGRRSLKVSLWKSLTGNLSNYVLLAFTITPKRLLICLHINLFSHCLFRCLFSDKKLVEPAIEHFSLLVGCFLAQIRMVVRRCASALQIIIQIKFIFFFSPVSSPNASACGDNLVKDDSLSDEKSPSVRGEAKRMKAEQMRELDALNATSTAGNLLENAAVNSQRLRTTAGRPVGDARGSANLKDGESFIGHLAFYLSEEDRCICDLVRLDDQLISVPLGNLLFQICYLNAF